MPKVHDWYLRSVIEVMTLLISRQALSLLDWNVFYFLSAVYDSRRVYISVYYYWTLVNIAQLPLPLENEARVPGYDTAYEAESFEFNAWIFSATS